jgi:hypothetical protein
MAKGVLKRTKRGVSLAQMPTISSDLPFLPAITLDLGLGKPPGQQKMAIPPGLLPF